MIKKLTHVAPARLPKCESTSKWSVDISHRIVTVSPHERRTDTILESIVTHLNNKYVIQMHKSDNHHEQANNKGVGTDKSREAVGTTVDFRRHWSK